MDSRVRDDGVGMMASEISTTLRVWQPTETTGDDSELGPHSTLTELFDRAFEPLCIRGQGLSPKTARVYREALAWWRTLAADPPLASIDEFTTARFADALTQQPGRKKGAMLSIGTQRKLIQQIDTLLKFSGPRGRSGRERYYQAILACPPPIDRPRPDHKPPAGDWTLEEIRSMIEAAETMTAPRRLAVPAPQWWQALIIVATYTGLRISQLMSLRYDAMKPPWISVAAESSKGRRGKRQYLAAPAIGAIEMIRTARELIFETASWPRNPRYLQTLLKRLQTRAGIDPERQFGWHGFRRTHATWLADLRDGGGVQAAQLSLGHGSATTTLGHYIAQRVQEAQAARAIDALPSLTAKAND